MSTDQVPILKGFDREGTRTGMHTTSGPAYAAFIRDLQLLQGLTATQPANAAQGRYLLQCA
jgi:hypothetical protein